MTLANRNRLAARLPADYADFGYAPIFADDMNALAGVAVDVELQKLSAALSDDITAANRVQSGLSRTAATSAGNSAATAVAVTLDQGVGERANDTSIWSMVRSTPAWGFGQGGLLEETAVDTIQWEFDPLTLAPFGASFAGARTNEIPNPRCEGAIAGTPGTPPTGWTLTASFSGLTTSVIGTGSENGIPYVDIRIAGTPSGSGGVTFLSFLAVGVAPASSGQTRTASYYVRLVGGTSANISLARLMANSGGSGSVVGAIYNPVAAPLWTQRFTHTITSDAGTTSVTSGLRCNFTIGLAVDATYRVGAPKQEIGPFASDPILAPVGVPAATTRAQGSVSIPVATLGNKYNYRQGLIIVDWNSQAGAFTSATDTDFFGIVSLGDLGANEVMGLLVNPAHTAALFRRTVGGVSKTTATMTITPPSAGETVRFAMAWDIDAQLMQVAARGSFGAQVTGANASEIPIITHLMPGRFSTTRPLYGRINGLEIRPAAVWGASLSALT